MMHGFPDTAHNWDDVRPRIAAKGYLVVSPFMRGHYPTDVPVNDADQETLAGYPLALIEALGADRAVLIGHDWGSAATYGAAALGPERVTKPGDLGSAAGKALRCPPFRDVQDPEGRETLRPQQLRDATRDLSTVVADLESQPRGVRRRPRVLRESGQP